jgi:hypothetical protein
MVNKLRWIFPALTVVFISGLATGCETDIDQVLRPCPPGDFIQCDREDWDSYVTSVTDLYDEYGYLEDNLDSALPDLLDLADDSSNSDPSCPPAPNLPLPGPNCDASRYINGFGNDEIKAFACLFAKGHVAFLCGGTCCAYSPCMPCRTSPSNWAAKVVANPYKGTTPGRSSIGEMAR